jgi:VIT1/CCC1 family predicted Fe2+/Mn2+ transporter
VTGKRRPWQSESIDIVFITGAIVLIGAVCVYAVVFLAHLIGDGWTAAVIAVLAGLAVIFAALALMSPHEEDVWGKDGDQ